MRHDDAKAKLAQMPCRPYWHVGNVQASSGPITLATVTFLSVLANLHRLISVAWRSRVNTTQDSIVEKAELLKSFSNLRGAYA